MDIEQQFNMIAKEYDSGRRRFIPCFEDYYVNTTDFIAANIVKPSRVLDLGAGTGLLSACWYNHFPESEYVLVDIAEDMLNVAKERFSGLGNVSFQISDYTKSLPQGDFDLIISALSIHHLEDMQKQVLFNRIYERLPKGSMFVNYDQFCAGTSELNVWYDTYWENKLKNSGLSHMDLERWKERRELDKECSVEDQTEMLRKSGFKTVKCVYTYQKFSVIVAIK